MPLISPQVASPRTKTERPLLLYFRSGWAFLIPYLVAYLLYAWLRWPVNPAAAGSSPVDGGQWAVVPCLLHVYWTLHAIHLILGAFALRSWWKAPTLELQLSTSTGAHSAHLPSTGHRLPSGMDRLWAAVPWLCLAAVFYIPGVYLEFPADPWQHYGRVNEWYWLQTVMEHSAWRKSSFFLAYSLIGQITPPVLQLKWFDVYYTGCCLLLCWQYYRLARLVGLGERASFIFVLIQALTFGNNLFGFYRYYGMSSTVFAQLGAVALTRIAIEALGRPKEQGEGSKEKGATPVHQPPPSLVRFFFSLSPPVSGLLHLAGTCIFLMPLIAFNHIQGIGIAGLGITAAVVWRLIEWRRPMIGWLALAASALSVATILWYPRNPALDQVYRPQGWLTSWYGFNLFQLSSPAFDRAAAIIGLSGLVNLVASLFLFRGNPLVAWLSIMPIVALCLPFVAVPFTSVLAADTSIDGGYIIAFHRFFFAIPSGLALVTLGAGLLDAGKKTGVGQIGQGKPPRGSALGSTYLLLPAPCFLLIFVVSALTLVPASNLNFNRFYNTLMVPPDDLAMRHVTQLPALNLLTTEQFLRASPDQLSATLLERGNFLTSPGLGYVLNSTGKTMLAGARKWMTWPNITPPSLIAYARLEGLKNIASHQVHDIPFWANPSLYTPSSMTGHVSQHWLSYAVALEHAAQDELFKRPMVTHTNLRVPQIWLEWFSPRDRRHFFSQGNGSAVKAADMDDRGALDNKAPDQRILAGDRITLRPVMRTLDGNGWRLSLAVQGPSSALFPDLFGHPSPLGGDSWIFGDHQILLAQPGEYTIDITGTVLWPTKSFTIRYHILVR